MLQKLEADPQPASVASPLSKGTPLQHNFGGVGLPCENFLFELFFSNSS